MTSLADEVRALAASLGFVRVGFAPAEVPPREAAALRTFLREGRQGEMAWMARTGDVRCDPRHEGMLPEATSVVALAAPYSLGANDDTQWGDFRVARYARGRDYHRVLGKRALEIEKLLRARGHLARAAVDTKPVLERTFAQRAGLGFIGKNACLIVPGLGSHVFLACIVTSAVLPYDEPMEERCGTCTRCLDGCPTSAFVGERALDARRCISYLTIEHEGEIDPSLREGIGAWVFGCDVCQDVCPYNHGRARGATVDEAFAPHARFHTSPLDVLSMDDAAFTAFAAGSPIHRAGRAGLARNVATALGNVGTRVHLPVLEHTAETHDDATVREAAAVASRAVRARDHSSSSKPGSSSAGSSSSSHGASSDAVRRT